jgi:hypothetical protein
MRFSVTQVTLQHFWADKMERDGWGEDAAGGELVPCNATSILRHFRGGTDAFARELELFLQQDSQDIKITARAVGLSTLLTTFKDTSNLDALYFLCDLDERVALASVLDEIQPAFSLRDKYALAMAPIGKDDYELKAAFAQFCQDLALSRIVCLPQIDGDGEWSIPRTPEDVMRMEARHRVYELYLWLGLRYESHFDAQDEARRLARICSSLISQALMTLGNSKKTDRRVAPRGGKRRGDRGRRR